VRVRTFFPLPFLRQPPGIFHCRRLFLYFSPLPPPNSWKLGRPWKSFFRSLGGSFMLRSFLASSTLCHPDGVYPILLQAASFFFSASFFFGSFAVRFFFDSPCPHVLLVLFLQDIDSHDSAKMTPSAVALLASYHVVGSAFHALFPQDVSPPAGQRPSPSSS